ncbi:tubulin-specific chaperone D [Histomonas meleagridis]|uniref:tubulin-specific chaperone D n=1 Tax=Histomonas meleagridis TaxID=135588 RepID=UPI00355A213D|nr:tubulin-specific chaperone D [Histomonas meleagridis]KAH0803899.1 tubulin-specific chaperone D [Histomonas meleagridis]
MAEKISVADNLSTIVINENKDSIVDDPLISESAILENEGEIQRLTQLLCQNVEDNESAAKIIDLVTKYQEMPQLLDPILAKLIGELTSTCRKYFGQPFPKTIYYCIYTLSKIRGFRELLQLFPNEVELFEPVSNAFCQKIERWEVLYVLLLWLSQLSLVPFDISFESEKRKKLISEIITKSTDLLSSPSRDSEASSFFLSRLLLRKDMIENRDAFLRNAFSSFSGNHERLITGYLRCIFYMLTSYDRSWVLPFASEILKSIGPLAESPSAHHRLFHAKIIQQLALSFLPPHIAPWRYQRGKRTVNIEKVGKHQQNSEVNNVSSGDDMYINEEYEVPLEVNTIIGMLFNALHSNLSIVRWSASKGIGRIVERLPYSFASQAIEYTFSLFEDTDNYNLINGACLCLVAFTLRGVLLPSVLLKTIPLIFNALTYDVQYGAHTVADNVRDSGCFICWAIARSYDGVHLESVATQIAQHLVNVFLFDRAVNVRRSASAAFQENVGRHGKFPHGLELIHVADFLSVSSRIGCFTKIAPFIAQFPEYGESIVTYLANNRIRHWDYEIRMLASQSLSIIATAQKELITEDIIYAICDCCSSYDIDVKHGGLEALGSLLRVIEIDYSIIKDYLVLPDECKSDDIKCSFIKMLSAATKRKIETPNLTQTIIEWLLSDSQKVQKSAIDALLYLKDEENKYLESNFFDELLTKISNPGIAASLISFPNWYLQTNIKRIIEIILNLLKNPETKIETKSNLLQSIVGISKFTDCKTVSELLSIGLNDRTTTKRGDEGASVRAMSLRMILELLPNEELAKSLLCDVLKLCLDRITGIRELSLEVMKKLVEAKTIPHRENLLFLKEENANDFKNFASLISVDDFAPFICEKLILCIGAYAPDLSQRAGNALIHFMQNSEENKVKMAKNVNTLFKKFRCDVTFTSSLFSFIPKILSEGLFMGKLLHDFTEEFLVTVTNFFKKITYRKLMVSAPTLAWLSILCVGEQKRKSFELFAPTFVCEYPVVREKAANELNEAIEVFSIFDHTEEEEENDETIDLIEMQNLLSDIDWKNDFDKCAEGITKLCEMFKVKVPKIEKKEVQQKKHVFSYRNLVKDSL